MEEGGSPQGQGPQEPEHRYQLTAGEQWERYGRYPYLVAKLLFWTIIIGGVVWTINFISAIALPIFISILLAYLFNPSVGRLEKRGISRSLGILILITALMSFFTVFVIFLYPTLATQVQRVAERAPEAVRLIDDQFLPWLGATFDVELPRTAAEAMEQYSEEIRDAIPAMLERGGEWLQTGITHVGALLVTLFNVILIPFFTFYFLRDFDKGKRRLMAHLPPPKRHILLDRLRKMDVAVGQWFRGQVQVSCILAVLYAIGLGLVYGLTGHDVQSGVVIGLLTGFLNVIPYVGFAIGSILAFMVVLIEWTGWWAPIGVAIAFLVIQTAESYYITPRVVGDKVGLKPVTVIIVLLIGGNVAGLIGVLLAIPIAGAVKVLLPDVLAWYQRSSYYTGKFIEPANLKWSTAQMIAGTDRAVDPQRATPFDLSAPPPPTEAYQPEVPRVYDSKEDLGEEDTEEAKDVEENGPAEGEAERVEADEERAPAPGAPEESGQLSDEEAEGQESEEREKK